MMNYIREQIWEVGGGAQGKEQVQCKDMGGSRAGRWEAGPREKNKYKVKTCCREQSWEVGGGALG